MSQQTQQLMQALRRASEAADQGDQQAAQDARRLAQMLQQAQQAGDPRSPQQQRTTFDEFARGVGTGLADIVGLVPGAAMELGNLTGLTDFEDTSGSNLLRRGMAPLGLAHPVDEDPRGRLAGAVGQATSTLGLPGVGVSHGLARRGLGEVTKRASGIIQRGRDLVVAPMAEVPAAGAGRRILDDMARQTARRPGLSGTAELTAAGTAGAGRYVAEQEFGEGSWQAGVGELIGGVAGGMAPVTAVQTIPLGVGRTMDMFPIARTVKDSVRRFFKLPESGTTQRAVRERMQEVTDLRGRLDSNDPVEAQAAAERLQQIQAGLRGEDPSVLPEYLTPAQRAGDEGIMSLAARARSDNPQLLAHWRAQADENLADIRARLQNLGAEGSTDLSDLSRLAQQDLDDMVVIAGANAQRKIASFRGRDALSRSEAGVVMRRELEDAYRGARAQERELWGAVPEDMVMPAETARARYLELRSQLGEITQADMPDVARRFMDPSSPETWLPPAQGDVQDVVSLKRLQELRSALLDEAANASSGVAPNRNRARIARQLADGILDDLQAVAPQESPGAAAFTAARDFSRHLNDRFTRGPVGEVLRMRPNREGVIPDEETLTRTLGKGGVAAQRATRAFVRALRDPSEGVQGAYRDFMDDDFATMAFRQDADGNYVLREGGAERFMQKYRDLFERSPGSAQRYRELIEAGQLYSAARQVSDGVAGVLGKSNPAAEVRRIRAQTSGAAGAPVWEGFRRNMLNELTRSATGTRDGQTVFSGQSIINRLDNDPRFARAMEATFSRTEMQRLRQLANTAARIERDLAASPAARLTDAEPTLLNQIIARVGGARAGAAVDRAMGSGGAGTSLQSAQLGSGILGRLAARGVRDPQARLINDALKNPDLLDSLLIPPQNQAMSDRFGTVVNAWATRVMDQETLGSLGLDEVRSLDDYIADATSGLGGRPSDSQRRRATRMEREDRISPAGSLPRQQGFQGPTIRGPEGPVSMGDALRGLPAPPAPETNPQIRPGSRPGGTLDEILRR